VKQTSVAELAEFFRRVDGMRQSKSCTIRLVEGYKLLYSDTIISEGESVPLKIFALGPDDSLDDNCLGNNEELMKNLRSGDILVNWKLDWLGRSLTPLVALVGELMAKGGGLQSINDPIDTTTPHGRLTFNLFASLAEFERDIIRERTKAGLKAARSRSRVGGRPKGLSQIAEATAAAAETLYRDGKMSTRQIATMLGISKSTHSIRTCGIKEWGVETIGDSRPQKR
jgi:hypothetical protein